VKKGIKKNRFAKVEARKRFDDPDDPQPGEFRFGWEAQLFRAGSKTSVHIEAKSRVTYESAQTAHRCGVEAVEQLGYNVLRDT
jgi:hypothetical protein